MRPEIQMSTVVSSRRITVTVRNVSSREIALKRGMPISYLFAVDVAPVPAAAEGSKHNLPQNLTYFSFNSGDSLLFEEWKRRLTDKMMERQYVFSTHEFDVGCSKSTHHTIRVTDDTAFRERSRRLSPVDVEDISKHLKNLKDAEIISPSRSPYALSIVVVRKKNGNIRMCVDYRTLNRCTVYDHYTVPRIEDALPSLNGNKCFSVLDLKRGF